jgi:glycosyltransferase involved in cell wall biosynthesis
MKILYITNNLRGDTGWSRASLDLITAIQDSGNEVRCIVATAVPAAMKQEALLRQPLMYLANPLRAWRTARVIQKSVVQFQPDVIHVLVEPYGHVIPFLRVGAARVFLTLNGTYAYIPRLIRHPIKRLSAYWLSSKLFGVVDNVLFISNFTKNFFFQHAPVSIQNTIRSKMCVITLGIVLDRYASASHFLNQTKIKQIVFVGAVKSRKGLREAVKALRAYRDRYGSDFHYTIIGGYDSDSLYVQELREAISDAQLSRQVSLVGRKTDQEVFEAYRQADLFLMLSINNDRNFEGFGLVYLEANAFGVPCIGPNDSGAQEAIVDSKTGFVVDPTNANAVAEKIHAVLDQGAISPNECRQWAEENSVAQMVKKMLVLYRA